ncbi:VirB8/TrbF family protein [Sphingobium naphthae]|uniref:VirB8/TrbF family protein n=1 Tax=Sphingobium naphthae TaxID=1886786 RepID=UPI002B0BDDD6|nr:VirB8/TrbF family protein [Pseudomonadota bacterium]
MSQVKWTETAFERGVQTGSSRWTGILTVVQRPPSTAETLRRNPLGIYIDAIDWSRELDPPAPAVAPTPPPRNNVPSGSPLDPNLGAPASAPSSPETQP